MASSDRPDPAPPAAESTELARTVSERVEAMRAVVPNSAQKAEPELLRDVMSTAQASQHELMRERNRAREALLKLELDAHAEERSAELAARADEQRSELGLLGRLLGGRENAPMAVAAIATVSGIAGFFVCLHYAAWSSTPDRFTRYADASLAFAGAAIAYIFGRGSRP